MNVDVNKIIDKLVGKLALLERDNAILLAQVESLTEALENLQKESPDQE